MRGLVWRQTYRRKYEDFGRKKLQFPEKTNDIIWNSDDLTLDLVTIESEAKIEPTILSECERRFL